MEEETAAAVLGIAFLLVTGTVLLLRPIAKRLAELVELVTHEKRVAMRERHPTSGPGLESFEGLEQRLRRVEDRLDFAEGLLGAPRGDRAGGLGAGPPDAPSSRPS